MRYDPVLSPDHCGWPHTLVKSGVGAPGAKAAHQGPNCNTWPYRCLFIGIQDVHLPGLHADEEASSGQSACFSCDPKALDGKPPHRVRRSIDVKFLPYW